MRSLPIAAAVVAMALAGCGGSSSSSSGSGATTPGTATAPVRGTAGSGTIAGRGFTPRLALAGLDGFGNLVIALSPRPGDDCDHLAGRDVVEVTVGALAPGKLDLATLPLGTPLAPGQGRYLQADFHASGSRRYPARKPGVAVTLTAVHSSAGGLTTGQVSVAPFVFAQRRYALEATFAATWCPAGL